MAKKPINKSTFEQSQFDAKHIQALEEMNRLMLNMHDYTLELTKQYKLQDNFVEQIVSNFIDFKNVSSAVLQVEKQIVAAEKQGNAVLATTLKIQYSLLQVELERQAVEENINKQLENSVSKISEFAKKIPFVGGLLSKHLEKGAKKFAKELSLAAAEAQSGLGGAAKTMSKSLFKTFGKGGTVLLGVAALSAALYGAYQLIAGMDETISHTAKNLGMSKSEVTDMAMAANAMGLSMEKVLHIVEDLNKAYGGINVINAQNIDQFEDQIKLTNTLVKGFGLSTEEAAGLTLNADLAGSSLERVTYEVMSQNAALEASGVYLGNQNQVLKDISKMSKTNAMIFGKNATALAKAATAAQLLGSNIEKQLSSAEGMLDIENSIQKEMRARALLGADINFDAIRLASLNGDVNGVLQGQIEAFKKVGDLSTKNTVEMGAFADAMGMSKDEAVQMSKNLVLAQKAGLNLEDFMADKISDSDLQRAAKTLNETERAEFEKMIASKKAASVQEEFNQALAGLKQALLPLLEPITKVVTFFAKLLTGINDATGGFAGMTLGLGLLVAGVYKLVQGFRKMSAAIDSVIALGQQAMQTGGGGIDDGGFDGGSKKSRRSGGLKRIGKAFKGGGMKGGMKAMGRMVYSGLSATQTNLGLGTGTTAGAKAGTTSVVGKVAEKGGILGKLGKALSGGFGKALGPIFSAISGISNIATMISDARAQAATGNAPSPGSFGKSLVQSAAYPIANLALNLIPGVGTILSFADGILSMMGISPIKWITDNLIGLIPDSAFTGLGEMALGDSVKAGANTAMDARAQDATLQVNDFMIDTNPNDKIGGVLDNRSVETMISLLGEMVNLLGERQQVVIGDAAVEQIGRRASARKSFR